MSFLDAYPERKVQGPQIPGQPVFEQAKVTQLRRQQLADLAYAFDIPVNLSGTKAELLPALIDAEKAGVFRQAPKRPEYLVKASRNPDEPPVDWEKHRPPGMDMGNLKTLQQIAKQWNAEHPDNKVDTFGKGTEDVRRMLLEVGAI